MLKSLKNMFIILMIVLLVKSYKCELLKENVIKFGKTIFENDLITSSFLQNNIIYENEQFNNTQCINQLNLLVSNLTDIWAIQGNQQCCII